MHETEDIKRALANPRDVCAALGLIDHAKRNARGLIVRCPAHNERTPSCSVTQGPDGTIRVRCFGCGFSGDVFHLIAAVDGLDPHRDFKRVLERAVRLAGIDVGSDSSGPRPMSPPPPERPYPPRDEIVRLWAYSLPVTDDMEAVAYFSARGLDNEALRRADLVRVLRDDTPPWAVYGALPWAHTGHRAIVRMFDARGVFRSVRALKLRSGGADTPKRLPPKGYRASGLVMANLLGVSMLRGTQQRLQVMVCEGEPDFLTIATEPSLAGVPLLGMVSGSWTGEIASRIPDGAEALVMTHNDKAGDGYANEVNVTIGHRCTVLRARVPQ